MPTLLSTINGGAKVGIQSDGTSLDNASKINFEANRVEVSAAGIATVYSNPLTLVGLWTTLTNKNKSNIATYGKHFQHQVWLGGLLLLGYIWHILDWDTISSSNRNTNIKSSHKFGKYSNIQKLWAANSREFNLIRCSFLITLLWFYY